LDFFFIFVFIFLKKGPAGSTQPFELGQKLARPKGMIIILPLHVEMDSACSSLDEEEGGNVGRKTT